MFDVKITVNGKPETSIASDDILLKAVIDGLKEAITSTITPAEARQITIDVVVADLANGRFSYNVSGPDEIVGKVSSALG